jgi:DNA-binding MarR family transcriptional regulator
MSMAELYRKPGHLFRRMQQIAVAIFMEECAAFDLTPVQYAALVAIGEHPGIDATRLSAMIAFDRSTLGSVIERLEAKSLILRRPNSEDKRVKLLELTQHGRALLELATPAVDKAQERMLAQLQPADRRILMRILTDLVDLNNDVSRAPLRVAAER